MASPKVTVRDGKCRGGKAVREAPSKKGWDKMIPSGMKNENHFDHTENREKLVNCLQAYIKCKPKERDLDQIVPKHHRALPHESLADARKYCSFDQKEQDIQKSMDPDGIPVFSGDAYANFDNDQVDGTLQEEHWQLLYDYFSLVTFYDDDLSEKVIHKTLRKFVDYQDIKGTKGLGTWMCNEIQWLKEDTVKITSAFLLHFLTARRWYALGNCPISFQKKERRLYFKSFLEDENEWMLPFWVHQCVPYMLDVAWIFQTEESESENQEIRNGVKDFLQEKFLNLLEACYLTVVDYQKAEPDLIPMKKVIKRVKQMTHATVPPELSQWPALSESFKDAKAKIPNIWEAPEPKIEDPQRQDICTISFGGMTLEDDGHSDFE